MELQSKDTKLLDTKDLNSSLIMSDFFEQILDSVLLGFECQLHLLEKMHLALPPFCLFYFKGQQSDMTCPSFLQ